MTNKDIQNIYFQDNEVNALYWGVDLIGKKENGGGEYMISGYTVEPNTTFKYNNEQNQATSDANGYFNLFIEEVPTNLYAFFKAQKTIKSIEFNKNFNTSNVTDMSVMFYDCDKLTTLDVSNFDTSNVTTMRAMFSHCNKLTTLDVSNFDTSNVTDMYDMFYGTRLTTLDVSNFDTSKVTNMYGMFGSASDMITLNLANFNTSNVTDMRNIFWACGCLKNVIGTFEGTKVDLDLSSCPLTPQSAMVFINGLAEVSETKTLRLSATTYDALTPEQIAIATSKGWTVSRG